MKRLALTLATGALLTLATPALAHQWRGGQSARSYPSYGYGSHRPNDQRIYQPYGYGTYRPYNRGYGRPVVIARQGPPYGWAWGNRRAYPARYGYYPQYGNYSYYGGNGNCGSYQNGGWNGNQGHSSDGWWGGNQGNHGNQGNQGNHGNHGNHGNNNNQQRYSNVSWGGNHQQTWNGRRDRDRDND